MQCSKWERKKKEWGEGYKIILYDLELERQGAEGPGIVKGSWEIIFCPLDFVDGKPKYGKGECLAQDITARKWQAPNPSTVYISNVAPN